MRPGLNEASRCDRQFQISDLNWESGSGGERSNPKGGYSLMRVYEVLFIVAPNIEESDIDTLVTQLSDVATNQGARIAKIDRMGRRRLAYPIGKFNDGHYVVFTV